VISWTDHVVRSAKMWPSVVREGMKDGKLSGPFVVVVVIMRTQRELRWLVSLCIDIIVDGDVPGNGGRAFLVLYRGRRVINWFVCSRLNHFAAFRR
jgi:hypothetical protein